MKKITVSVVLIVSMLLMSLPVASVWAAPATSIDSAVSVAPNASVNVALPCGGASGVQNWTYWWGVETKLNECWTQTLINVMWGGTGVAVICAVMTGACVVPGGLAAGILAIGAAYVATVDVWGGNKGVYIYHVWTGTSWVWY